MSSGLSVEGITSGSRVQEVAMRRADDMFNKLDSLGSLAKTSEPSFADRFVDSLNSVAEAQNTSKTMTQNYELGKENDLAKVMVAQQVSSLGFQLALNFRNKALSAYKDILNMPSLKWVGYLSATSVYGDHSGNWVDETS